MRFVGLICLATLVVSCSLQATLSLSPTGSAEIAAQIALQPSAKTAWKNLRELDPGLPIDPLDPQLLRKGLGSGAAVSTRNDGTSVQFSLPELRKLVPTASWGADTWELTLDRKAVRKFISLTGWEGSPAVEALIPSPETAITESEYQELLVYFLGPETSEAAAKTLVEASMVELTIEAPRPLKSAAGAIRISGKKAVYRWPLVRILTLNPPILLKLAY